MSDKISIKEVNGLYKINDTTDGGYVTRVSRYTCDWQTIWNDKLEMLEFYFNGEKNHWVLAAKEDFDHHRAIRARARHLKALKIYLGLDKVKEEKPKQSILYSRNDRFSLGIFKADVIMHEKTIILNGYAEKKNSLKYALATEEKLRLANEYNQKKDEFEAYKQNVFEQIFKEE